MEDKDRKLHENVGGKENNLEENKDSEKTETANIEQQTSASNEEITSENEEVTTVEGSVKTVDTETDETAELATTENNTTETEKEPEQESISEVTTVAQEPTEEIAVSATEDKELLEEIDESNAEDAEDDNNKERHTIPMLDYHAMSMENLVGELQRLVKNEKVQAINKHVNGIKYEFDLKFQEFIEEKKEEFVANGGNEIDFRYNSVTKRQFNEVFAEYREKRDTYYRNLEKNLKDNLENRLGLIEELKALINVEEDINTTYNNFKAIQERWKNAGPVPRNSYNDVWRTYHHHMEIFYDFLHLNRELRDLDFKHNLEEKLKIIGRAEALAEEPDLSKAFYELQTLHKVWKEDIGPVAKDVREQIWERFSNATKVMHNRRQNYYKELDAQYEKNLERKNEIISAIKAVAENISTEHKALQKQIKTVESLREDFFNAGKVPQKVNEETWSAFKESVRAFNRNKNAFYKNLKKEQHDNLEKKKALLGLALALKDSEDYEMATPEMKRIQSEWKKIGHVPRKYSDKIWNEFKDTCNHYFNRLHALKNEEQKGEFANFKEKQACLDRLKLFELSGDREKDLAEVKAYINEWKNYGRIPQNKIHINIKFNKIIDAIFKKLDISKQEAELLRYGNKIKDLANTDNNRAIGHERTFIRRKIDEANSEIRQLENNLQFFSNASEDNPLVKEVVKNINRHKEALATWKAKLKKLNIIEHGLAKEAEAKEAADGADTEATEETE